MSAPLRFALLALLLARTCAAFEWKTCGVGSLKVTSVDLTPEPVPPGATAQFSIAAEASEPASGGTITMLVYFSGVPIWRQVDNLCDKAACPIAAGPTTIAFSQLFPEITPPGTYTVQLDGADGGRSLFCLSVTFQVAYVSGRATIGGDGDSGGGTLPAQLREQ